MWNLYENQPKVSKISLPLRRKSRGETVMFTLSEHFYSMSAMAFILSCVFFATVRWFHVCRPCDETSSYHYPNRTLSTFLCLLTVILIPYTLHPGDAAFWQFFKSYFIVMYPLCSALLLLNYFGGLKNWHKWKLSAMFISTFTGLGILSSFLAIVWPGRQLSDDQLHNIYLFTLVLGVLMIIYCLFALARVILWMKEFQSDHFSNDEDFPMHYARQVICFPPLQIILIVAVIISDSQMLMAVVNVLFGIFNIYHLLIVLPPRHKILVEEEKEEEKEPAVSQQKEKSFMSDKTAASIMERIQWLFEHEKLYLNPHLTVEDVAGKCQFGCTYVSYVFKNSMGGFFNYVNKFRLQYADDYQSSHPTATQEEIAEVSGFSSRQSLYRVRQRLMWDKNTE